MRKFLWLLLLVLLGTIPASAQTARGFGWCELGGQKLDAAGIKTTPDVQASFPGCTVTVYLTGTLTLATIYSDRSNTPLANPFTASTSNGFWVFYASTATNYDVTLSGGTPVPFPSPFTIGDYALGGGGGGGGGSSIIGCSTINGVVYQNGTANVGTCNPAWTFNPATAFPGPVLYFDTALANIIGPQTHINYHGTGTPAGQIIGEQTEVSSNGSVGVASALLAARQTSVQNNTSTGGVFTDIIGDDVLVNTGSAAQTNSTGVRVTFQGTIDGTNAYGFRVMPGSPTTATAWSFYADNLPAFFGGGVSATTLAAQNQNTNSVVAVNSLGIQTNACTAPASPGKYILEWSPTTNASVFPDCNQVGLAASTSTGATDTILYSDNNNVKTYQGAVAVTVTLPTPATLGNPNFYTVLTNKTTGAQTIITVTPTTLTINGVASLPIFQGEKCSIYLDPANRTTNWLSVCDSPTTWPFTNASTGTSIGSVVKLIDTAGALQVAKTAVTDTLNAYGCVQYGPGTSGIAQVAQNGTAICLFDNSTVTDGDYVIVSTATAGTLADGGTTAVAGVLNLGIASGSHAACGAPPCGPYTVILTTPNSVGSGSSFNPAIPGPIGGTTPSTGKFTSLFANLLSLFGATAGATTCTQGPPNGHSIFMTITDECPPIVTAYEYSRPGAGTAGELGASLNSAGVVVQSYSGDSNHSAVVVIGSGADIAATSLCSTANCPAGTYRVNVYVNLTTPCGTSGTFIAWLGYTDDSGARTGSSTTTFFELQGTGSVPATGTLTTTSTANFGQATYILRTTGAATSALGSINYGVTRTACGTAGPMVGKMYLSVEPIQ